MPRELQHMTKITHNFPRWNFETILKVVVRVSIPAVSACDPGSVVLFQSLWMAGIHPHCGDLKALSPNGSQL